MNKRKINYNKKWNKNGTCYTQNVNITQEELSIIQAKHCIEHFNNKNDKDNKIDYFYKLFLGHPNDCEFSKNVVFTNCTQRDFFSKILKLKLKDRNTCFIINK